ncbi:MAG: hypothetical protein R2729_20015 [Bryobacteraceae bacterium]
MLDELPDASELVDDLLAEAVDIAADLMIDRAFRWDEEEDDDADTA